MTYATATINPFFAARFKRVAHSPRPQQQPERRHEPEPPVYAKLPRAPKNASPVPHLTSLYHFSRAGEYGDRSYPGNCGGNLIRDLLLFFRRELDACDPKDFPGADTFDFIWAHPPYWCMKLYADDPRDLSRSPTLEHFLRRYGQFIRNCAGALKRGGKLAILMGDYSDREAGFLPLTYHTKRLAFAAGLRQCCTDIVRFSHGASSGKKVYRSSFIPGLHDICCIFEKTN